MSPFWHLFGDLFFVEISFEAVGYSMGSDPCFSPAGSKVTSGRFLSVPVCHEKLVFRTVHFSLKKLANIDNFIFVWHTFIFSSFLGLSIFDGESWLILRIS